ncbi:MAG TPA: hypothetical protein VGI33_18985 [Paenibacillus sp.]
MERWNHVSRNNSVNLLRAWHGQRAGCEAQVKSAEGRLKPLIREGMPTDMPDG